MGIQVDDLETVATRTGTRQHNRNRLSVLRATAGSARPTYLFATAGLGRYTSPDGTRQELSIEVPASDVPPQWPAELLLRIAEGCRRSEWTITHDGPLLLDERQSFQPLATMAALAATPDPWLPGPHGRVVQLTRLYGLFETEIDMIESWSCEGVMALIRSRDPTLVTDITRPTWDSEPHLKHEIETWTAVEGSSAGAIVSPGLRWERLPESYRVRLAGGRAARRLRASIRGRLGFGRQLLVHDGECGPHGELALMPSDSLWCKEHLGLLVVGMPPSAPEVEKLIDSERSHVWELPARS